MGERMSKIIDKALSNPIQLAIGAGIVIGIVYFLGRKTLSAAAGGAAGIVTGNNAATKGTAYEGKGVVGTVAAVADRASGGTLSGIGEALGGWLYDATHPEYDPNKGVIRDGDVLQEGARNTDTLWGRIGGVILRN